MMGRLLAVSGAFGLTLADFHCIAQASGDNHVHLAVAHDARGLIRPSRPFPRPLLRTGLIVFSRNWFGHDELLFT
jgi:hypothetical protein